jgi:hypothetical protein
MHCPTMRENAPREYHSGIAGPMAHAIHPGIMSSRPKARTRSRQSAPSDRPIRRPQ